MREVKRKQLGFADRELRQQVRSLLSKLDDAEVPQPRNCCGNSGSKERFENQGSCLPSRRLPHAGAVDLRENRVPPFGRGGSGEISSLHAAHRLQRGTVAALRPKKSPSIPLFQRGRSAFAVRSMLGANQLPNPNLDKSDAAIVDGAVDEQAHERFASFREEAHQALFNQNIVSGGDAITYGRETDDLFDAAGGERLDFARRVGRVRAGLVPIDLSAVGKRIEDLFTHPFNFQQSEAALDFFNPVTYARFRTRREDVRGGRTIRLAKGLPPVRLGAFRGRPVDVPEQLDVGMLAVTTLHIYFAGQRERFRIALDRIVYLEQVSEDGMAIERDAAKTGPEAFFRQGAGQLLTELVRRAPTLHI
jgi:hypothetical protein